MTPTATKPKRKKVRASTTTTRDQKRDQELLSLAETAVKHHTAGTAALTTGLEHYKAAGDALLKAKKIVGHGNFKDWLEKSVKISRETVTLYIRLAKNWDASKMVTVTNMTLRGALAALAPKKKLGADEWEKPEGWDEDCKVQIKQAVEACKQIALWTWPECSQQTALRTICKDWLDGKSSKDYDKRS